MLEEQIKTYTASLVRTVVPLLVGHLLAWLALIGVPLPETVGPTLSGLLVLVIGTLLSIAYYALFRWLELRWPAFGVFLGKASQPLAYSTEPEVAKAVINRALDATRDRAPDEQGVTEDAALPEALARHRAGGKYRAEGTP